MTIEQAMELIHGVAWRGSRPGLARVRELLHRLGDPQDGLQVVQLITDDHTAVRLYLDGTVPQCAELSVDDTLCLRCTMENWNLEQGSMNDESQDPNLGRDQSQ